jgi:branched-chain amino acid transport system substrate-binding protein
VIRRWRILAATVALVGVGMSAAACSSDGGAASSTGGSSDPFKLLVMTAQSGSLADAGGIPATQGIKTIVDLINKEGGGIRGRQVELSVVDTASDATQAVSNLQSYLATNPKPDAVFSGVYSSEALPVTPILKQAGLVSACACVSPAVTNPKDFPTSFTSAYYASMASAAMVDELKSKGYKKIGYVAADNESGHAQVNTFTSIAQSAGLTVSSEFYPVDAVDTSAALDSLRADGIDALVMYAPPAAAPVLLQSRTKLGWTIPSYGDAPFASAPISTTTSKADWKNVLLQAQQFAVVGTPMATTPAFDQFMAAYKAQWGEAALNKTGLANTVSPSMAILILKAAFDATDSDDPNQVAAALEAMGTSPIPDSISKFWIGPATLGITPQSHASLWGPDDFEYIPVVPMVNGMYNPADAAK